MPEELIPMTKEGYEMYKEKLRRLETVERSAVAERIRQAKEFGDISDNAEYESAKSDQAFVEGEIAQLKRLLTRVKIIDRADLDTSKVNLGTTVEIQNTASKDHFTVTIVGTTEADMEKGRISNESPVGAALLERKKGETVEIKTPAGMTEYKVLAIRAPEEISR
ncbi:MAG: transcription elongation factor GreA [Armatimonadetes bacterium]|nr:transcription elongation factor GreA [Armatimonadota bacterium]